MYAHIYILIYPDRQKCKEPDVMKIVWEVQESFLNAALDEIQARHNGIQNYLHSQLGLTPAAQSKLQSLYLA